MASTTTTGTNLFAANRQWATRPADERFWTVEDARDFCGNYAATADELEVNFGRSALVVGEGDNIRLALPDGREATLTNWAFGQLARTAAAPADYIRRLPADLAIRCVEHGLDQHFAGRDQMTRSALVHNGTGTVLRSLTSDRYSRFWNHKVFSRLLDLQGQGWRVPPARPTGVSDPRARPATAADVLRDKEGGGGLSVKVGDLIAPAGVYASDHDMWAFMVNENARIDDGSDGGLSRGFFVSNSEVGAAALRVTLFHYRHVCGNHICWGAEDVIEVAVRHIGDVEGRFSVELAQAVDSWAQHSAVEEQAKVRRARTTVLGATDDEVLDAVFKAFSGKRRYNLPSGLSVKMIAGALDVAKAHEDTDGNPFSVWGVVNGITRLSQATGWADERNFLDRAASAVLNLAV